MTKATHARGVLVAKASIGAREDCESPTRLHLLSAEGGSGADVFALSSGRDRIIDFNLEDGDKIAIQGHDVGNFTVTPTEFGSLVSVEGYGSLEIDISLEGIDLAIYVVQAV